MQVRHGQLLGAGFVVATIVATTASSAPAARADRGVPVRAALSCALSPDERTWVARSLDAWERVSTRFLHLAPQARPPIILFDATCEYRLAPESLMIVGREHGGHVQLPNGQNLAPTALGFASLATGDTAPFLVVALRSVWESDSTLMDEDWDQFLTRSFIHEMTHTRQLPQLVSRLRAAGGLVGMNDVNDDIVQETFDTSAAFSAAVHREIGLLYDAALARSAADRERRARLALQAIKARREHFYGGEAAPWSYVEQLMLDLEGAAEFAEFSYLRLTVPRVPLLSLIDRVRENRDFWSQDEGLALFLLLDALRHDWPGETFRVEPRSSVELIEEALPPRP